MTLDEHLIANIHRRIDGITLVRTGACRVGEAYCHPLAYEFISGMVDRLAKLERVLEAAKAQGHGAWAKHDGDCALCAAVAEAEVK